MRHSLCVALVALLPLAVFACATDEEEPTLDDSDLVSFNGLAPEALLGNGDALMALGAAPLDGATTELTGTKDGQALLTDVVKCALDTGDAASFPLPDGTSLVLPGLLGLAPNWKGGAIGEADQRFMTACLMAHVNGRETPFPISVRSERRKVDVTEELAFPAEEMAVFGNIFVPADQRELSACFGEAVAQTLGSSGGVGDRLGVPNYLDVRFCSIDEQCGFNLVGACFRFDRSVPTSACENRSDFYAECHESPIQVSRTPSIHEAVTVYLQPGDLALLLTEYTEDICQATGICVPLDLGGLLGGIL